MQTYVVDQNGSPATWLGPGMMMPARTYVTIDPRSGDTAMVVVLDASEPMVTLPFAVIQEFQRA